DAHMNTTLPLFPEGQPTDPTAAADASGSLPRARGRAGVGAPGAHRTPLLDALFRSGHLRTLDHALAQSLRRLDPDTPDAVLAAAALASLAVASGHAGFDPAQPQRLVDAPIDWPTIDAWRDALQSSSWVAHPASGDAESLADAPLVFEQGLVYLRRYREYERRLAAGLHRIGRAEISSPPPSHPPLTGQDARRADGGHPTHPTDDHHPHAAAAALHHSLLLVTGGPGTGKTTTITRMLVALIAQATESGAASPRIALAAPTGRAAERMAESVRNAVQALSPRGIDPTLAAQLPTTG